MTIFILLYNEMSVDAFLEDSQSRDGTQRTCRLTFFRCNFYRYRQANRRSGINVSTRRGRRSSISVRVVRRAVVARKGANKKERKREKKKYRDVKQSKRGVQRTR